MTHTKMNTNTTNNDNHHRKQAKHHFDAYLDRVFSLSDRKATLAMLNKARLSIEVAIADAKAEADKEQPNG